LAKVQIEYLESKSHPRSDDIQAKEETGASFDNAPLTVEEGGGSGVTIADEAGIAGEDDNNIYD
jgi:hypothetical protein